MKPTEALYYLERFPDQIGVPALYRDMPREQLEALVKECERPSPTEISDRALLRWAQQRLNMPNWADPKDKKKEEAAAPAATALVAVEPLPAEPETLISRALKKEGRLSTTARRKAAFRYHYARCSSITEAAARAGVDRRTVNRWRKADPAFDQSCADILAMRRRMAEEDVVLIAGRPEVRPIFHRGKQVGQILRRDRALDLYLLKRADAEAARAERRREATEGAAQEAAKAAVEAKEAMERDIEARIAAAVEKAVERRISQMSRSAGHDPMHAEDEFTRVFNDFEPATYDMALAR